MRAVTSPAGIGRARSGWSRNASRMKFDPDRYRGPAAFLALAERPLLIEPDPDGGDDVAIEAVEPGVARLVGGAGLAGDVAALQRQTGADAGAALDDVGHHVVHDPVILWRDHARRHLRGGQQRRQRAVGPAIRIAACSRWTRWRCRSIRRVAARGGRDQVALRRLCGVASRRRAVAGGAGRRTVRRPPWDWPGRPSGRAALSMRSMKYESTR